MKQVNLKKIVKEMFNVSLYDYQLKFLKDCIHNNRVVGAFCRQTGKSMTIAILAVIEGLKNPNGHIIIVAPTDRQAGELFLKISNFLKRTNAKEFMESFTQRQLVLKNGCRIAAYPCGDDGNNIRGLTGNVLIIEEAAFVKDNIVNEVLLPMVAATQGKIIKISTPFGLNHFYISFQKDENYISHRYTWEDAVRVNHFNKSFIDEQRKQCSSLQFRTEYEAEFIADQDAYFSSDLVEKCISDYELMKETESVVNGDSKYYLGVDFARMGQDQSVFVVVEKGEPNKVVFIKSLAKNTMDEALDYILFLHSKFKFQKIVCDQTGLGAGVVDMLAKELNKNTSSSLTNYNIKYDNQDIVIGLTFTVKNKQDIFSNLKILMEQDKIIYPNHKSLVYELKDFRYEITPSGNLKLHHSENGHDDFVDALACSVHLLKEEEYNFFFG